MDPFFSSIWKMQLDLNKIIGRDTVESPERNTWVYDYTQALEDEVVELKNCINWKWWSKESKEHGQYLKLIDPKNAKIEAIDSLHFLMSLLHIFNQPINDGFIDPVNFDADFRDKDIPSTLFSVCEMMIDSCRMIKSSTGADVIDFIETRKIIIHEDSITNQLKVLWVHLNLVFYLLDMKADDIYNIYKMKHEKNVKRQEDNYSVLTKTEDDNNQIKDKI